MPAPYRAVLFDFDGTLADTAPDLGNALNRMLAARSRPPLPLETLRPLSSEGARGMLKIGFNKHPGDADYDTLRNEYLDIYEAHMLCDTRLFDGIDQVLDTLAARAIPWGIVTNKLERFALPLISQMGLTARAGCVIGGDTTARAKPAPDPLLEGARRIRATPAQCLHVGDDLRDVQAAHAAGMEPVVARYGYPGNEEPPEQWGAAIHIQHPPRSLEISLERATSCDNQSVTQNTGAPWVRRGSRSMAVHVKVQSPCKSAGK